MTNQATESVFTVRPFTIAVSDTELADLRARLEKTRFPSTPADAGWRYGTARPFMEKVVDHWIHRYDWRAVERRLNRFPHFIANVDGYDIHYIHVRGSGPRPLPLILTHGWPGSFVEFDDVIEPLAHPERFGGSADDAFDVIVPSIPGYGWSSPPPHPVTTREIAPLWNKLMTQVGSLSDLWAQGRDWGSLIASWLGVDFADRVAAIPYQHHGAASLYGEGREPFSADELAWLDAARQRCGRESGDQAIQGTKPPTLAFGG